MRSGVAFASVLVASLVLGSIPGAIATTAVPQITSIGADDPPAALTGGPPFDPPLMVSGTRPVFGEWHTNVLPNGNIIVGWIDVGNGVGCGFSTSEDGGRTWGTPSVMASTSNSGGDPVVTVDKDGNVYRSCIFQPSGKSKGTWYQKSSDGGLTWDTTTDRVISPFDDYQWAASDNGTIWQIYNNGNSGLRTSVNEGVTWQSKSNVGNGWPSCVQYVDGLLFGFTGQEGQAMNFFKSTDRGVTFVKKTVGTVKGGSRGECQLDVARDLMYFAWAQGGMGGTGSGPSTAVQVFVSRDRGDTFDAPVVVHDPGAKSDFASLFVGPDGQVHVGWMDSSESPPQAYYSNSTDEGKTWSAPVKISTHTQTGAQLIHYGKGMVVTLDGDPCFSYPARGSTSSSTSMYVSCARIGGGGGGGITRIDVSPPTASITADQTQQFTAQAFNSTGAQMNATFTWSATGGTVSMGGLYTPSASGTFTVSARATGRTGTAQVTVANGAVVSLTVTPANPTIAIGQTLRFAAEAVDAKGNTWSLPTATWAASVGTIDSSGLFTPSQVGTSTITGTDPASGAKGTTQVTVTAGGIATITVSPATATITADQTQSFAASAVDSQGNPVTATFAWGAAAGTVSANGLYTPDRTGTWTVTASSGGKSGTASVTVRPGGLANIEVLPTGQTITADDTLKFSARGLDAKGNEVTSQPSWTWSTTSGQIDGTGIFVPLLKGAWTITASGGGLSGTAAVNVVPGKLAKIDVSPATSTIAADQTKQFAASGQDAKGNALVPVPQWSWNVDDGGISPTGLFTPAAVGDRTITASSGAVSGSARLTVTPGKLAKLTIDPSTAELAVGERVGFTLVATDSKGNGIDPFEVRWEVVDARVGQVDDAGTFTAKAAGKTVVRATASNGGGSAVAEATVTVVPGNSTFDGTLFGLPWWIIAMAIIAVVIGLVALLASRPKRQVGSQSPPEWANYGEPGYQGSGRSLDGPSGPSK